MTHEEHKQLHLFFLKRIYDSGSFFSPILKDNPKFNVGEHADGVHFIWAGDVVDRRYVVRWRKDIKNEESNMDGDVVATYDSIEAIIEDGWRCD